MIQHLSSRLRGRRCTSLGVKSAAVLALISSAWATSVQAAEMQLHGRVRSGSIPIAHAKIVFYAAGTDGYGSTPVRLTQTRSDDSGEFSIGNFQCPSDNSETYLLAKGGDAGNGPNEAIGLMALTGDCKGLHASSFVTVNELTTVAAQWALAQFIDPPGIRIGAPTTNTLGLQNAFNGALANLVRSVGTGPDDSGVPAKFLPTASQCEAFPSGLNCDGLERLNTLANVLATCIESSGHRSTECSTLFENSGALRAANTVEAANLIVTNPTRNVAAIWHLQEMSPHAPYQPSLTTAPKGWELALEFIPPGATFALPVWVAVDGPGNIWVVNGLSSSVSELPAGNYFDGASNFAPPNAGLFVPFAVALDTAGNVFVANAAGNSVSELPVGNFNAGATSFSPANAAFSFPSAVALDTSDNVWIANLGSTTGVPCDLSGTMPPCGSISELLVGNYATDAVNFAPTEAAFDALFTIAVDRRGNIWTTNDFGNSASELTAGNFNQGFSFAPSSAGLNLPVAIALDNSDNAWIANQSNPQ